MTIKIIEFSNMNLCGRWDYDTMYLVDGKRISRNDYFKWYSTPFGKKHEHTQCYTKGNKNYTIITYK